MRTIAALLLLWVPLAWCAEEPDWSQGQLIYGDPVVAGETKGKVLFFIYWGADCPPCRVAMMKLREYQAQFGPTGAFCVVASHSQTNQEAALAFLKQANINFPVYQFLRHPLDQPNGGIPFAVLVNASGELAGSGSPTQLYPMIPMLTEQAAMVRRYTSSPLTHPLDGLATETFLKYAEPFTPGKTWQGSLKKLRNAAKKNTDLDIVVSTVETYLQNQPGKLDELAKEQPAAAYIQLGILLKSLKGMPEAKAVQEQFDKLAEDQNVKDLAQILSNIEKFRVTSQKLKPSAQKSKIKGFLKALETFANREELDSALVNEAQKKQDEMNIGQ